MWGAKKKKSTWEYNEDNEGGRTVKYTEESGAATVGALIGTAIAGPVGGVVGAVATMVIAKIMKDK